ncbi:AraC-type DNA-binding protein [Mesonia phycicola]|uniref:AraC-type DNA-binding protein n=1 Tax=Mesonia phycicola TaxID=579105 RepID=A0A1M6A9V4_9FLAO|nr:AraC family transcriptional regulator [Mesonia phycicola]SHI33304.1 AraC-type DNA-binding protein [Mesonia phycicola]
MVNNQEKFLELVDKNPESIFCYHNLHNVEEQNSFSKHTHNKGQLSYVEGGTLQVETDEKIYFVPGNHYIWIPKGVAHSIYSNSKEVLIRTLYIPIKQDEVEYYSNVGVYPANDLLLQLLLHTKDWTGDIEESNRKLYPIVQSIKVLLPDFSKKPINFTIPKIQNEKLNEVSIFLNNNLDKNIMLSELANKFNINERSLHRLFKKDINISFIKFFTIIRMYKAIDYLSQKKYSISEIASKVGYSSIPTFSNTFYKVIGKRPSDYQRGAEILK